MEHPVMTLGALLAGAAILAIVLRFAMRRLRAVLNSFPFSPSPTSQTRKVNLSLVVSVGLCLAARALAAGRKFAEARARLAASADKVAAAGLSGKLGALLKEISRLEAEEREERAAAARAKIASGGVQFQPRTNTSRPFTRKRNRCPPARRRDGAFLLKRLASRLKDRSQRAAIHGRPGLDLDARLHLGRGVPEPAGPDPHVRQARPLDAHEHHRAERGKCLATHLDLLPLLWGGRAARIRKKLGMRGGSARKQLSRLASEGEMIRRGVNVARDTHRKAAERGPEAHHLGARA